MKVEMTDLPGVFFVTPVKHLDPRGFFTETFRLDRLVPHIGKTTQFVQDNFSQSERKGTVRGLHCQIGEHAQGKLVSCSRGSILDVAVDVRPGSRTYGQHITKELTEASQCALYIPQGFLHGFVSLTDGAQVRYKCTAYYDQTAERTVLWNDKDLGIDWGINAADAIVSAKDKLGQPFNAIDWA